MATTGLGTPYVESSDLVSAYPTASQSLAQSIDNRVVNVFADSTARSTAITSPTEGMVSYLQDTNALEAYDGSAWAAIAGGKLLQVVRGTDATTRTTTSTSYVDASISVTITPTSASSSILLVWSAYAVPFSGAATIMYVQITDSANTAISGAEETQIGLQAATDSYHAMTIVGYDSPATTSATTYKGRYKANSGVSARFVNATRTAQLFALEIGA